MIFRVYLNTVENFEVNGRNNNGLWVSLPVSDSELKTAYNELAGITGESINEMEVIISDCETDLDSYELTEESVEELNEIAKTLDNLYDEDIQKVDAIMEYTGCTIQTAIDTMDSYDYYANTNLSDYAYSMVQDMYGYDNNKFLLRYFDYEKLEDDLYDDGYRETLNGVIRRV